MALQAVSGDAVLQAASEAVPEEVSMCRIGLRQNEDVVVVTYCISTTSSHADGRTVTRWVCSARRRWLQRRIPRPRYGIAFLTCVVAYTDPRLGGF